MPAACALLQALTEVYRAGGSKGLARHGQRCRQLSYLLIVCCVITLISTGCAHRAKAPLIQVEVAQPVLRDVPIYSEWIGTTVGFIDAQIHPKVTGYLLAQDYKEGSLIKVGDLLFEVDPRPFQAIVDQANAQLGVASAELAQARADVDAARAEIDRAEAAQLKTELDVKRYTPLVQDGSVSHQEMDDSVQSNLANQASVVGAKGEYNHALAAVKAAQAMRQCRYPPRWGQWSAQATLRRSGASCVLRV